MEQESVQCDGYECWLHQECVGMTTSQYVTFSQPHLRFFCRHCVSNRDGHNFLACLSRIAECAPDVSRMRARAESERNLLRFYDVSLPDVVRVSPDNLVTHNQPVKLLGDYSPWLLDQFVPVDVAGDGNCLFRAVSAALYGTEAYHSQLRLLAAIEVLMNCDLYDNTSGNYYEQYRVDDRSQLTSRAAVITVLLCLPQVKQRDYGHKFWDDCGARTDSQRRKMFVDASTSSELRQLPDGLHGMRKRVDTKRVIVPLDPQPSQVYEVHQLCNRLKRDEKCQRRITYLTDSDCYVIDCKLSTLSN